MSDSLSLKIIWSLLGIAGLLCGSIFTNYLTRINSLEHRVALVEVTVATTTQKLASLDQATNISRTEQLARFERLATITERLALLEQKMEMLYTKSGIEGQ